MTTTQQQPATALAVIDPRDTPLATQVFGEDRIQLLAEQIGRGWDHPPTIEELEAIAVICQRARLDPLAKPAQIYFIKRYDSVAKKKVMVGQVSIDGARMSAARTGNYLGPAGTQWCGPDAVWKDIWLDAKPPAAARHGIWVRGGKQPMWATVLYSEYVQKTGDGKPTQFWRDMPANQLAKCAEFKVLKQACPGETNDLELAERDEIRRLEAPARAAEYERMWGGDEDHAFAELPEGAGAPPYAAPRERTDLEDLPRDERQLPPPAEQIPAAVDAARARRGDLLEMYSTLLSTARRDGVVNDAAPWVLRSDTPDAEIIAKGRELRALVNQATVARSSQAKVEMVDVRSPLYERLSDLIEEAARLEVPFDDLRVVEWPATEEDVQRKVGKLTERLDDEKQRLAEVPF